jgi:hypothetical protein
MSKVHTKKNSYSFNVSNSEYSKYNTSNITIDSTLAAKYSDSVVEYAKLLKAKNGTKYSDAYYLEYAKNQALREIQGSIGAFYKKNAANLPIQDIAWAAYSYEEIIQMENDGYNIPEDVLLWAHAQQQSDITDYIVLSESTDSAENSNTEATTGTDELSQLQKVAKENILKVDKAIDKSEEKQEEYNQAAVIANRVKKENEKSYQENLQKIENDTKEWKKLDDKKRSGAKLSLTERIRYAALSEKLLSSEDAATANITQNNTKLESYLETLDGIQKDIEINTQLAADTIQSGKDLSSYTQQFPEERTPNVTSGVRFNGSGLFSDSLYNVSQTDIASLAVEKGDKLNQNILSVSDIINSSNGLDLTQFAQSYVTLAQEVIENKNNIINGENSENSDENSEQNTNKKSNNSNKYDVAMIFSAINSEVSTAITLAATANLLNKNNETKQKEKLLQTLLKKSENETQKVSKEAAKTEEVGMQNEIKEEEYLTQLENMQTDNTSTKPEDKASKKDELVQNIENTETENSSAKTELTKQIQKGKTSTEKTNKFQNLLKVKNQELISTKNNTSQVAKKTTVIGAGTIVKSVTSTLIGTDLYLTGLPLTTNPFTVFEGEMMIQEGMSFIAQGIHEFNAGTIATVTGAASLVTSAIATETATGATRSVKDALISIKDNNNEIKESAKAGDNQDNSNVVNGISTNENNTETTVNNDNSQGNVSGEEAPTENIETNNTETTTDKTPETDETSETTEATETDDSVESSEGTNQAEEGTSTKKAQSNNSVSLIFGIDGAINATNTTQRTTNQMVSQKTSVKAQSTKINEETKKSTNIIKEIEKETTKAETEHEINMAEAETLANQISSEQLTAKTSNNSTVAATAQTKIEELSTSLDEVIEQDGEVTEPAEDSITSGIKQLAKFQKNTSNLQNDIFELNKDTSIQLKNSINTTVVGAGTMALGIKNTIAGSDTIAMGMSLLSNPLTASMGAALVATGYIILTTGILENSTGFIASATGIDGISENASAKSQSKDAQDDVNSSTTQLKTADKSIQNAVNDLLAAEENPEDKVSGTNNTTETSENDETDEETVPDETTLAAAATTGVDVNTLNTTDDNSNKKLSRFNSDSIIHSKKKNKKVLNVSASMTNKKGKH